MADQVTGGGFVVAGSLHLWFYTFSSQGKKLKYDQRPLMMNCRQFTLGGQIRGNMFWTLGTGVFIWTLYEVILFWALANGYMPMLTWAANPVWFVAIFFLVPIWESLYFYCIHRAIHFPFFYKHVHYLHHRYFECNYGSLEIPWDKWFGSFHDGTVQANESMRERHKRIMGK